MEYRDKHILVLGAGTSGIGAAHIAAILGAHVVLNDYASIKLEADIETQLLNAGVTIITGSQDNNLLCDIEQIIVSPGISLSIPILVEARRRHIPIIGEVDLAYHISKAPILGVTGTNGKTTTTTLLADVMKAVNTHVYVGGNIGKSLSEAAYRVPTDGYLIAELSSYQLESVKEFRAHGAIVLNVTPDHLARHKTLEAYAKAKANIFKNQDNHDYLVLNADDMIVKAMEDNADGTILYISQKQKVYNGAYYANGVCYAVSNGIEEAIIDVSHILIPGAHNIENILSVIALTYALGVTKDILYNVISQFSGVEHRLEKVAVIREVTYYNDSKATNVDSVIKALQSFTAPVILLAGGHDKMTPLHDLMDLIKCKTKALLLMGEAADRFEKSAREAGVLSIYRVNSMREAVELGQKLAVPNDVVLLSPACSSFDWYSCFEERGDDFKREVMRLAQQG